MSSLKKKKKSFSDLAFKSTMLIICITLNYCQDMFYFTVHYNFYHIFTHIMQKSPKNSRTESSSLNVNISHLPWFVPSQSFRFIVTFRPPHQNNLLEAALQESTISVPTPALLAGLALGCDHCDFHGLLKP